MLIPTTTALFFASPVVTSEGQFDPTETPARIDLNLPDIDSHLSTLREGQSLKPYQKQKSKLQCDLESSSSPCPVPSLWRRPLLRIFPVFLCGRTARERLRCTALLVNFLARGGLPGAHALPPWRRVRWIASLGNCGLYSLTWGVVASETIFLALEIPPRIPALSVTLLHYERNRPMLGLPRSRPRPSSLISFFNFEHFSEAKSLMTTSLLRSVTSLHGIWPSFVCSFSRAIGLRILDPCSPKRFSPARR